MRTLNIRIEPNTTDALERAGSPRPGKPANTQAST